MREWPPDSARGETAREARKMRVSMRVCHATTPERAECVDLRMRHVWSSVRSEHADHSLPDNHGRAITPHDRGCFVVASGAPRAPAFRERTSQPTVDIDRLKRHIMCISTNVLSQGHAAEAAAVLMTVLTTEIRGTSSGDVRRAGGQARRPAPSARSTSAKRRD